MELKELYDKLYSNTKNSNEAKEQLKEVKTEVKADYALALGLVKKTGEADSGKIKSTPFDEALKLHQELTDKNKLEENLDNQEKYMADMENGTITKDNILRIVSNMDNVEEAKQSINETKKEASSFFDKGTITGIQEIIKLKLKNEKLLEEGKGTDSEKLKQLKNLAKELNIDI